MENYYPLSYVLLFLTAVNVISRRQIKRRSIQIAVTEVCKQMSQVPPWAKGLLLDADGYECDFYQKD